MECETDRLLLRQWRLDDVDAFTAFWRDPVATRFVGGTCDEETAWRKMATYVGHWSLRGHGYWAVEEKDRGRLCGAVGLWQSASWPEMELGYWLMPFCHGLGYATEAAGRARDVAFVEMGRETLVSYIDLDNLPSRRVAERLGGRLDGQIELGSFGTHDVYRYTP